ncbi:MAG: response regulator, partial [Proteobacteria bacterium]
GNGASGVEAALQNHYDVILMDIQMPVMDGHEAARSLRLQGYSRPIVALTAHAMKEERLRAEQSGFSHFLTKPIHRKSLIDLLEILLVTLTASHQR